MPKKPKEDLSQKFYEALLVAYRVALDQHIEPGTPQGDLLVDVTRAILCYENKFWPMQGPEPVDPGPKKDRHGCMFGDYP